jgi:phage protein D
MSIAATMTTRPLVKIDGAEISSEMNAAISRLEVDLNRHLPGMLTLTLTVDDTRWLNANHAQVSEGKEIELSMLEHGQPKKLFLGKISSIEVLIEETEHPLVTMRAYDLSFGLHRKRARRTFVNVSDSDVARTMAQEAGLTADVVSSSTIHPHLFQNNQTSYEFLLERAQRLGYDLYVSERKLCFKPAYEAAGSPIDLSLGTNLRRFKVRTSTFEPPKEVQVRSWDPKTKRPIIGRSAQSEGLPTIGDGRPPRTVAESAWTSDMFVVTDEVARTQSEADKMATSVMNELGGSFITAECLSEGFASIQPGCKVKIAEVGQRFSGQYYVTSALHTYDARSGHQTAFTVSARRADTVAERLDETRPRARIDAPVIAIVTDIKDPDKLGRVKVKYPYLSDDHTSWWARIATPMSGSLRGFHFLPEVDDEVLVAFEHGDINHPYIIGCIWNGKDKPPVPPALPGGRDSEILQGAAVKNRLVKSTQGNMLIFNDSTSAPGVFLVGKSGAYVMVDDKTGEEKIAIADKTRKDFIEIRSQDKSIHIICEGPMFLTATGNITIETKGNLDAKVTGNATVKATGNVAVEATGGNVTLKGINVSVEATAVLTLKGASVELSATAAAQVKGATITVQGTGPTAVKGTPLLLN